MAEYIERKKAVDAIADTMATGFVEDRFITPQELQDLQDELEMLPAADVAPVVHGRFVNMGGFPACDRCGASPGAFEPKPDNPSGFPPYCYACGAKMDKEETDGLDTP